MKDSKLDDGRLRLDIEPGEGGMCDEIVVAGQRYDRNSLTLEPGAILGWRVGETLVAVRLLRSQGIERQQPELRGPVGYRIGPVADGGLCLDCPLAHDLGQPVHVEKGTERRNETTKGSALRVFGFAALAASLATSNRVQADSRPVQAILDVAVATSAKTLTLPKGRVLVEGKLWAQGAKDLVIEGACTTLVFADNEGTIGSFSKATRSSRPSRGTIQPRRSGRAEIVDLSNGRHHAALASVAADETCPRSVSPSQEISDGSTSGPTESAKNPHEGHKDGPDNNPDAQSREPPKRSPPPMRRIRFGPGRTGQRLPGTAP